MAVSKRLRYEVLRRDNHTCRYCGRSAPHVPITVDHVVPVALGGTDTADNLVAACRDCNAGKAATNPDAPLIADVTEKALRWQLAIDLATSLARRDQERIDTLTGHVLDEWNHRWELAGWQRVPATPPFDARLTLGDLIIRGLDWLIAIDMIDVTVAKYGRDRYFPTDSVWPYFLGCCRNKLNDLEHHARQLIDEGQV